MTLEERLEKHLAKTPVVDESAFPPTGKPLTLEERFERAMYLLRADDIVACYSEGRRIK